MLFIAVVQFATSFISNLSM